MTSQHDTNQEAYIEEQEKLEDVIRTIQARSSRIRLGLPARAGDTRTADLVQGIRVKELANLEAALRQPISEG